MGKMKHIPLLLLAAVLAVGCSQDELFDPAGEGRRPLVIKATGLSVTEAGITRATVDGSWDGDETVAVSVTDDEGTFGVFSYTAASDGTLTSSSPYFWKAQPIEVMAWYPYSAEFPTTVTVAADQSTLEGFKGSDALEASRELTENDCELKFSHRVAKVTFKLKGESTALDGLSDVTVVGVTGVDGDGNSVTPYQPDAAVHTYQVLLAPQTLAAGKTALTLTKNNFTYAWVPDKDYKLVENYSYTFELTVAANKPQITLTGCTISGWTDINYNENIPMPNLDNVQFYDLSDVDEIRTAYTITGDGTYYFYGNPEDTVNVTNGQQAIVLRNFTGTIILDNLNLFGGNGNKQNLIEVLDGANVTIQVNGNNSLLLFPNRKNSLWAHRGVYVEEGSSVTIAGNSRADVLTTDGIGGYSTNEFVSNCGNINIKNVTVCAYGFFHSNSSLSPGIGGAQDGKCGDITIDDATVYAYGYYGFQHGCPGIGSGYHYLRNQMGTHGTITIKNGSDVYVQRGRDYSDYIGYSGTVDNPASGGIVADVDETSTITKLN